MKVKQYRRKLIQQRIMKVKQYRRKLIQQRILFLSILLLKVPFQVLADWEEEEMTSLFCFGIGQSA